MANNRASLMNVGREVDYAVRALSYMAVALRSGVPTRRAEIGQAQAIPRHYLAKILRKAVDGGLVESGVGPRGGFWLARDPARISLRDVYECINGPMCLVECLAEKPAGGPLICDFEEVCPQAGVWRGAHCGCAAGGGAFDLTCWGFDGVGAGSSLVLGGLGGAWRRRFFCSSSLRSSLGSGPVLGPGGRPSFGITLVGCGAGCWS